MMILTSQAYVLRRIWGIKTSNKSYLKCLLKSWASHLFIEDNSKISLYEQGAIGYTKLRNFPEKNWKEWLKCFNRYNLSPKIWYGIAPQEWRSRVNEHWKREEKRILSTGGDRNTNIYQRGKRFSTANPPFERTGKRNKILRNNLLTHSYFDSGENPTTKRFLELNKKPACNDIITNKTRESRSICAEKEDSPDLSTENIFFKCNLLLWLVPEFMERRDTYQYEEISDLETFVVKKKNREILRNQELLREGEFDRSIRQWRWKSKNLERKFRKLGNMASLMTFMQDQEAMVSLSEKMRKDLDLFRLSFRRNTNTDRLTINSEHRLPRLLNDRILVYKMVSAPSNFEQRLKQISNLENLDGYSLDVGVPEDEKETKLFLFDSFNLEDTLLSKRRREFRILNSLFPYKEKNYKESNGNLPKRIKGQNRGIGTNKNKTIKRFIWSSYRFEDLACMNRFWLNTMNGGRFSMLRFRMYPPNNSGTIY